MKLYRPVGLKELQLIMESDFAAFPPRLAQQPIFYPVLNATYARQIAERWNTVDAMSGYVGFITEFDIDDDFAKRFPVQLAGDKDVHQELWVPSEELEQFNQHIVGKIKVIEHFVGEQCGVTIDEDSHLPV